MYFFIDDIRVPEEVTWVRLPYLLDGAKWTIIRSYDQWLEALNHVDKILHVSFDHDLADIHYGGDYSDEKTGFHCAKALTEWCMDRSRPLPTWTVHSMNPVGASNINGLLSNFKRIFN